MAKRSPHHSNKDRLKKQREFQLNKREQQLDALGPDEVLFELKSKGLPVFGTNKEKLDRLKKSHGVPVTLDPTKRGNVLNNIEAISKRRDERRRKMEEEKLAKDEKRAGNQALGKNVDVDFQCMVEQFRAQLPAPSAHTPVSGLSICVCVRKRPIFAREELSGEIDAVTGLHPQLLVHEPKFKVDGFTKYLETHSFTFDSSFSENDDNTVIYDTVLRPLCPFMLQNGTVTCFAYGQTGSGKTYTMKGLQRMVVHDLCSSAQNASFVISFYEIYGGKCFDLLNGRAKLSILEDGNGNVQIHPLKEVTVHREAEVLQLIEYGHSVRTTHSTTSNEDSSRSHAICQITIKLHNKTLGNLRLVDLAGSERAQDCISNCRQRRIEGAEINKSLLALKECIRALRKGPDAYVPYRGSKLTLVLRDSFEGKEDKKVIMVTCVSPGHSSSDHTLNSLRYSDRLKEQSAGNVQLFQPKAEGNRARPAPRKDSKENLEAKSFLDINEEGKLSSEMLNFHEKVETILAEEEKLLDAHMLAIKEDAALLTQEGELIAMAQGEGKGEYDIDQYVDRLGKLVGQKLAVYQNLYEKLVAFKRHLNEEEEVSHNLTQNANRNPNSVK